MAWSNALAGDVRAVVRAQARRVRRAGHARAAERASLPEDVLELFDAFGSETAGSFTTSGAGPDDDGGDARADHA